jgi:hypothetical protein
MGDHEIMRSMAVDYRREAEGVADPARRDHLVGLAEYCQKMAAAMERVGTKGSGRGGPKPRPGKPTD